MQDDQEKSIKHLRGVSDSNDTPGTEDIHKSSIDSAAVLSENVSPTIVNKKKKSKKKSNKNTSEAAEVEETSDSHAGEIPHTTSEVKTVSPEQNICDKKRIDNANEKDDCTISTHEDTHQFVDKKM